MILFSLRKPSIEQARIIHDCLARFCGASSQKISYGKSCTYFSNNMPPENKHRVSTALGIVETEDFGTYLGMPTLTSRVTRNTFAYLCEKINRRLSGCKSKFLSLAGRITLAKSTLNTMSNYAMQTAKIPRGVCDEIDKRTRRFIWGGSEDHRKIHLLPWDKLQLPKGQGGLGIRSSRNINSAFLTKLGWRVLTEPHSLWSTVLRAKYCKGRCDLDMFETKSNMSNVWKGITENAVHIYEGARVAVNNGISTLFWDHKCVGDHTLRSLAIGAIPPEIEGATVSEMWDNNLGWKWENFADLLPGDSLQRIEAYIVQPDSSIEDPIYWGGSAKGRFTIKSAMRIIKKDDEVIDDRSWELAWRLRVAKE